MKYVPSQPPEGINVTDEHPLKSFIILTTGAIGSIFALLFIISLFADTVVGFIPIKYEQSFFEDKNIGNLIIENDGQSPQEVVDYLQHLVDALHSQSEEKYKDHQFKVSLVKMEQPNAFAAPGGYIVVTTELLKSIQTENGLSMVLAHEIGHHYERHPLRGLGRGIVMALFLSVISGVDAGGFANQFLEKTAFIGQLAYSRKQETDSDNIAISLLKKHYGHANGASEFFSFIQSHELNHNEPPEFLSTHPATEQRLEYLRSFEKIGFDEKTDIPNNIAKIIEKEF